MRTTDLQSGGPVSASHAKVSLAQAQRIHVVGGRGSGKSTLAPLLAAPNRLPVYDLDRLAYEEAGESETWRPLSDRLADVRRIAAAPAWVTEGKYLWWTDELVRAADLIVWLDLPWQVEAWRVVRRFVYLHRAGYHHFSLLWLLRALCRVVWYHMRTAPVGTPDPDGPTSRAATALALIAYMEKVIHCRTPAAVKALLSVDLSADGAAPAGIESGPT